MGKLSNLKVSVGRGLNMAKLQVAVHSPEILVGVGAIAMVSACVFAAKRTKSFEEVLDQYHDDRKNIEEAIAESAERGDVAYTEEDAKNDTITAVVELCQGFVKSYWPTIILGSVSIVCNVSAISIEKKRLKTAISDAAAIAASFAAYRKAVVDKYGEAADRAILYGEETTELVEETVKEDGSTEVKAVEFVKATKDFKGLTRRFFSNDCIYGGAGAAYASLFASSIQHYACCELDAKGVLFVNELLDELGQSHELSKKELARGQQLGWIRNPERPWDGQFEVKTTKAIVGGVKGVIVEFPEPISVLGYLSRMED